MDQATRQLVRTRAAGRCEYCRIHEEDDLVLPFYVEHICARKHGGDDDDANLALACHHCNLHMGPNLSGVDPVTNSIVEIFHPRQQRWADHFRQEAGFIQGLTRVGRVTIRVLAMNRKNRVQLRRAVKPP